MGNGLSHINHPENYSHHNCACIEYVEQLRKIQKEVDRAISLSRGTYFDADSIKLLKEHKWFSKLTFEHGNNTTDYAPSSAKRDWTEGLDTA